MAEELRQMTIFDYLENEATGEGYTYIKDGNSHEEEPEQRIG